MEHFFHLAHTSFDVIDFLPYYNTSLFLIIHPLTSSGSSIVAVLRIQDGNDEEEKKYNEFFYLTICMHANECKCNGI